MEKRTKEKIMLSYLNDRLINSKYKGMEPLGVRSVVLPDHGSGWRMPDDLKKEMEWHYEHGLAD